MKALRHVTMRRRGETSWLVLRWPDGREAHRISQRPILPEQDGLVMVFATDGRGLRMLYGEKAEAVWDATVGE